MAVDPTTPILIVDDYQAMVRIIRNLLQQLGFAQIDEAHDGEAALAKLKERAFGLVISDWNMEPMSGLELLERVRATPALEDLPFIMVTAEKPRRPRRPGARGRGQRLRRQAVQRGHAEPADRERDRRLTSVACERHGLQRSPGCSRRSPPASATRSQPRPRRSRCASPRTRASGGWCWNGRRRSCSTATRTASD